MDLIAVVFAKLKKATALICYPDYPEVIDMKNKIHKAKLLEAHNTVKYDKSK
jgi:hypothetical protein